MTFLIQNVAYYKDIFLFFFLGIALLHFFQELALGWKTWFIIDVAIPVDLRDLFPSRMGSLFSTGRKVKNHGIEGGT